MDVQFDDKYSRNGVEGEYFNFVPLIVSSIINKAKQKKYKSKQAQDLQYAYPFAETIIEQDKLVIKLKALKSAKERQINASRAASSKKIQQAELDAINEYISDAVAYRKELLDAEKQAVVDAEQAKIDSIKEAEQKEAEKQKAEIEEAQIKSAEQEAMLSAKSSKKNKIILIAGIGLAAFLLLIVLVKKKNK